MVAESVPKRVVTVVISITVMLTLTAFFLMVYGNAQRDVESTQVKTEAQCQAICQELLTSAFGYDNCEELMNNPQSQNYADNCSPVRGPCTVTIKQSITCIIQ